MRSSVFRACFVAGALVLMATSCVTGGRGRSSATTTTTSTTTTTIAGPPYGLSGEVLTSQTEGTIVTGSCNPTGTSTFFFTASGTATGPITGTFTEKVTNISWGPQDAFGNAVTTAFTGILTLTPTGGPSTIVNLAFDPSVRVSGCGGTGPIAGQVSSNYTVTSASYTGQGTGHLTANIHTSPLDPPVADPSHNLNQYID